MNPVGSILRADVGPICAPITRRAVIDLIFCGNDLIPLYDYARVIPLIRKSLKNGLTYQQIADQLNTMGIKTRRKQSMDSSKCAKESFSPRTCIQQYKC